MPKILISDAMDSIAEKILLSKKIEVDVKTNLSNEQLLNQISLYDGLIVRSATKVTKEIISMASNLKVIGRAGAGVDNIDLSAAKEKNILVMNTPGGNTNATAEHTLGLLLSLFRNIPEANYGTHKGIWDKKNLKGNEIKGKTIGIIGFGNVGRNFANICHSLGLKILIHSNYFDSVKLQYPQYKSTDLENLCKESDIVSLHCKGNKDGSPKLTKNQIGLMKKNCCIINTARGNLIDETDLKNALTNNIIKGAALDVFNTEPANDNQLFNLKNIILSPHIAASTYESQIIVAEMISKQFCDYFNNGKLINIVN
tara:strand:+ start:1270 stop:2208 length:939 start_codon:yes stop_codon:yes gene_type:complete